ncbi:hypothetical protein ACFL6I_19470 [candidate division KSB1 bacterium]
MGVGDLLDRLNGVEEIPSYESPRRRSTDKTRIFALMQTERKIGKGPSKHYLTGPDRERDTGKSVLGRGIDDIYKTPSRDLTYESAVPEPKPKDDSDTLTDVFGDFCDDGDLLRLEEDEEVCEEFGFAESAEAPDVFEEIDEVEICSLEADLDTGPKPQPSKEEFVVLLTDLLESLPHYKNVEIQSIRKQKKTRIPINIVTFLYGKDQNMLGKIFIKDYADKSSSSKRKDMVMPAYLSRLDIPTATVIGFDPREDEYKQRYALMQLPVLRDSVLLDRAGIDDFTSVVDELNNERVVENSLKIIELMAMMHVKGTMHLDMLKSDYGLELEKTDHALLIKERFLDQLALVPSADNTKLLEKFMRAHSDLKKLENNPIYMQHADFTLNQIRVGGSLDHYLILDWELTRKDGLSPEDLATFTLCVLRAKPDLNRRIVEGRFIKKYHTTFSNTSRHEGAGYNMSAKDVLLQARLETVRGHEYKLGDQIWTQDDFGESIFRKQKAEHHFRQFYNSAGRLAKQTDMGETIKVLMSCFTDLVDASPKLLYLKEAVQEVKQIHHL